MRHILFTILIFFLCIGAAYAGNNTTTVDNPTIHLEDAETVTALESGDSNISFSNRYKGYCIEWGEHSAEENDTFYIEKTFKIYNKETHEDVSNHIKVFFTYFYPESQKDKIVTQHIIWKFTDNKEFSQFRANKELYYKILNKSAEVQVPDSGIYKINETHSLFFDFKVFVSQYEEFQNYFGYKFFVFEHDNQINSSTINNNTTIIPQVYNNNTNFTFNEFIVDDKNNSTDTSTSDYKKIVISSHETGININWLIIYIVFLMVTILLLY